MEQLEHTKYLLIMFDLIWVWFVVSQNNEQCQRSHITITNIIIIMMKYCDNYLPECDKETHKVNKCFWKKWGQQTCLMQSCPKPSICLKKKKKKNTKNLTVSVVHSKAKLNKTKQACTHKTWGILKLHRRQTEGAPKWSKLEQFQQQNKKLQYQILNCRIKHITMNPY